MSESSPPNQPPIKKTPTRVIIADFDMPFWSIVNFMVKVALASIPASIVIMIFYCFAGIALFMMLSMLGVLANIPSNLR